jgi:hypothetical protein
MSPKHTDVYDLEPEIPRVRRIKAPHKAHPIFDEIVRSPAVISILTKLIGPGQRLHGSKLNMKSAQYGSPVEWHQDWAFYPHSNDDVLAIDVLLDDCDLENGPMLVTPRSHTSQSLWNHHGDDGCFAGLIDPDLIQDEINRAVPCAGKAGSMSFHHGRALHGSATNTSNKPRNLVLYEVAASDAWPLMGVKDFAEAEFGAGVTRHPGGRPGRVERHRDINGTNARHGCRLDRARFEKAHGRAARSGRRHPDAHVAVRDRDIIDEAEIDDVDAEFRIDHDARRLPDTAGEIFSHSGARKVSSYVDPSPVKPPSHR